MQFLNYRVFLGEGVRKVNRRLTDEMAIWGKDGITAITMHEHLGGVSKRLMSGSRSRFKVADVEEDRNVRPSKNSMSCRAC